MPTPVAVTAHEIADLYSVSLRSVERWTAAGCPVLRLPGRGTDRKTIRYSPAAVAAWLEAQATPAPAPAKRGRPRRTVGDGAA